MNLEPTDDQQMLLDAFTRFLDEESSIARVRAALPTGFDAELWSGLGELGALGLRVAEDKGGLGLGLFDAVLLMEQAGRTLVSGPLAEALVANSLLADLGGDGDLLGEAIAGSAVVTLAMHDAGEQPVQLVAGGAAACGVIARRGDDVVIRLLPTRSNFHLRKSLEHVESGSTKTAVYRPQFTALEHH